MLLDGREFSEKLVESVSESNKSFMVFSAFVKYKALFDSRFLESLWGRKVTIVARWQKHDLIAGASDLEVYNKCKERGWRFGIDLNLHGKLFLIDDERIFLGSANLTQRGLHIDLVGNNEFGTMISPDCVDLKKIDDFINSEVIWMTDELFELISNEVKVSNTKMENIYFSSWSERIKNLIVKPVEFLWVQELVFRTPSEILKLNLNDEMSIHDFELLDLNIDCLTENVLKSAFKRTRLYRWLYFILREKSLSFGGLSAQLHNAILDDPKPYRVDIKKYNQILFKWAEFLSEDFQITRPNYSQVLSLKNNIVD